MTAPAQDDRYAFDLDPAAHAATLQVALSKATLDVERWRTIAMQEREANLELARRLAEAQQQQEGDEPPAG